MLHDQLFDFLPLWGFLALTLGLILLAIEGGYRLGRYRQRLSREEKEAPVGAMLGATMGLLGFMLAFTFGAAAARHNTRKDMVLAEANAIGTAYLRTELLPDSTAADKARAILRDYVQVRLDAIDPALTVAAIKRSEAIHDELWQVAAEEGRAYDRTAVTLFVQSVNEVIDAASNRVTAAVHNRIPGTIWIVLIWMSLIAMGSVGYHSGLARTSRSLALLALAVTFSAVIWLIADLDRPQEGTMSISQRSMEELRESMAGH